MTDGGSQPPAEEIGLYEKDKAIKIATITLNRPGFPNASARNRPTDTIVMQKTVFEIFKQQQGEYLGSILAGWLEGMLPSVKEDGSGIAVDSVTFEKSLAAAVKDNDRGFPPEWRLSYKACAQKS